jgi:hypothetical protein
MVAFQKGWKEIVNHAGADYLHMAEAWPLVRHFSSRNGWTEQRRNDLLVRLLRYMAEFRRFDESTDLLGLSCSIDLCAYREVSSLRRLKEPESICVDYCFGHQFHRLPKPAPKYLSLYFDRSEGFRHKLNRIWKRKVNGQRVWWGEYVTEVSDVNMRAMPAIQAADLIGWTTNRERTSRHQNDAQFLHIGLNLCAAIFHKTYDREALLSESHVIRKDPYFA